MKTGVRIKSIVFDSSPDCCMDENETPEMTVEFVDNGAGNFVRISSAHVMPIDGDEMVNFAEFIEWVCKQNDDMIN